VRRIASSFIRVHHATEEQDGTAFLFFFLKQKRVVNDKQGGGLSILQNWQPGMGVPDDPNPNREAPRERPRSDGGRAFPND
jgi:hypothetical protein